MLPPIPPRRASADPSVIPNGNGSIDPTWTHFSVSLRSQLRRLPESIGAGEIAGDRNENATREPVDESADFRLAEDTTTWSSLAIARDNVQQGEPQSNNVNNNLTEPKIQRNSSVESLADYEGEYRSKIL